MKAVFQKKKVKYGGMYHPVNTEFEIGAEDAERLQKLGATIIKTAEEIAAEEIAVTGDSAEKASKKAK